MHSSALDGAWPEWVLNIYSVHSHSKEIYQKCYSAFAYFCENREIVKIRHVTSALAK